MNASLELFHELGPADVSRARPSVSPSRSCDWALDRDDVELVTPSDPARRGGDRLGAAARCARARATRLTAANVAHSLREGRDPALAALLQHRDEVDARSGVIGALDIIAP